MLQRKVELPFALFPFFFACRPLFVLLFIAVSRLLQHNCWLTVFYITWDWLPGKQREKAWIDLDSVKLELKNSQLFCFGPS